jgi:hypothetical protein
MGRTVLAPLLEIAYEEGGDPGNARGRVRERDETRRVTS